MSTNFTIPIGTTDPANLCNGLPLFPALGTARAGISASSRSYKLIDVSLTIAFTRLNISAYAGYGFGLCGPALAFVSRNVAVNMANNLGQGQLTLNFNEGLFVQAGAFVGAYAAGGLTLTAQVYLPKPWYKVWSFAWQTAFTIDKDFKVDLLALMFTLIRYLLTKNPKASFNKDLQNRLKEAQPFVTSFSLDATAGSSSAVTPNIQPTPQVTAPLNLANYVPKLKAINDGLAKIGGEISVGPTVHLQFPVTFNIDKFTIVGGVQGGPSAEYGNVRYVGGKQVIASGNTQFNFLENPSRVTTHVTYQTTVKLVLSIHFRVKVAKFFNVEVNTPSLDLTYLLYRVRESDRTLAVNNSVSTGVQGGGCVLTPNMTLTFVGPTGTGTDIQTGELAYGTVTLIGFQSSSPATVTLVIDPPAPNFPGSVTIPAGSNSVKFSFTFQNQCLATGNPNAPNETAPPSPVSPVQSYRVTATLTPPSTVPCSDYEVVAPLNITNRFLRCNGFNTFPGTPPPWDGRASATIKADIASSPSGGSQVICTLWFPYAAGESIATNIPITFTLLDENRQPYAGSGVEVVGGGVRMSLKPSGTLNLTLAPSFESAINGSFFIFWNTKGRATGYSNRFYLIVNAGCQYGQTEFWLDVYNWS